VKPRALVVDDDEGLRYTLTGILEDHDLDVEAVGEADAADRSFDQAQEALADLRTQADQMIADVMAELRFTLRSKDAASQRRIMRTYGATFAYLDGEPRDPDDQPDQL